jgi:hypothetical protein
LAGLEAPICFIDDVNASLAPHNAIIAVAPTEGFQRVTDFHSNLALFGELHKATAPPLSMQPRSMALKFSIRSHLKTIYSDKKTL